MELERIFPAAVGEGLSRMTLAQTVAYWDKVEALGREQKNLIKVVRGLCQCDLFYLLVRVCGRRDLVNLWLYERIREVESAPDDHLDLWARGHGKSSIITFGKTIQDILNDPDITVGIFSHTRPIAKAFLRQIMREFEQNLLLHQAFPDVLWGADIRAAPKWSEDDGIIVRRKSNPPEGTIEAWGLIDGQPTSKHFRVLMYDDIVVEGSVTTPEMIEKTRKALEQSYNLSSKKHVRRFAGTRWHFNDTYRTIMDRKTAVVREYPGTDDGTEDGKPVFLSAEQMVEKRRDMGPHTFCLAGDMRVLMSDWSWKTINSIKTGDSVVGYVFSEKRGYRTELVETKVLTTSNMIGNLNEYTLESGKKIRCTPNHKWWSGRHGTDGHNVYSALGENSYRDLHGLVKITEVFDATSSSSEAEKWGWLAGIIDGEGTISKRGQIVISQSPEHNPEVCARIEEVLAQLGIEYSTWDRAAGILYGRNSKSGRMYILRGGRPMKHRLIMKSSMAKKQKVIERGLYGKIGGMHADSFNEKVVSVKPFGEFDVFNLETETGNYIAEGYASKNSAQILLNPKADALQGFKREWLRFYKIKPARTNNYILVDAASSKKKGSDYTAMWVVGLGTDGNYYALDIVRDRLNLTERTERLFALHRKWKPKQVRYEKAGMQADIEHIKSEQEQQSYRFDVTEVGVTTKKIDRIGRMIPIFEQGRFYLPHSLHVTDYQKMVVDLVHTFVEEEYLPFPVGIHDDALDALARIAEPDLRLAWPKEELMSLRYIPPPRRAGENSVAWMG